MATSLSLPMAGAHVEPRSVPLAASGETREALGRKAPADAMEALLGAAVLAGGLEAACAVMRQLPWFGTEDGDGYVVPLGSPTDAASWLGAAVVRLSCSAWVLCHHPELSAQGLSDLRQELLMQGDARLACVRIIPLLFLFQEAWKCTP
ncbi:unnamed protein product, partial [Effrenium voratum]